MQKLFYVIIGATPKGRTTEQHDVFFGIAKNIKDLIPEMKTFWPETKGKFHLDAYQEVKFVDGFELKIVPRNLSELQEKHLFFINLGGYKPGIFQEFHEKHLMIGKKMSEIIRRVKKTEFYKTMGFKNAESHIDDKYGVDIDDIYKVEDLISPKTKEKYAIILEKTDLENQENITNIGYFSLKSLK
ncbi:DUF1543 domain-containing protein [Halpernia sp.]|uniref:DUF1543 domain-containing protein n=1 Tax=Halpernia sp. TaxID=2782209 RepID=UPI003A8FD167